MGGLKKKLPVTFWTFLLATLAIIGFPLTSGFFSKDEILAEVFKNNPVLWGLTVFSAVLTGIYMLRMFFLTFYGGFRGTEAQQHHLHESPATMTIPLAVLALLSVVGGVLNIPALFSENGQWLSHWLHPVLVQYGEGHVAHLSHSTEWILMGITTSLVLVVIAVSYVIYVGKNTVPAEDADQKGFTKLSAQKFYIDELYHLCIERPVEGVSTFAHRFVEGLIDGVVHGVARLVSSLSNGLKWLQNGNVEYYLAAMVAGIIIILVFNTLF
jgi:NADH-quinone oxidoreductase subunit L